jgi:hypothetical protein
MTILPSAAKAASLRWRPHRTMHAYQKIDSKPGLSEGIGSFAGSEIADNWHEHCVRGGEN